MAPASKKGKSAFAVRQEIEPLKAVEVVEDDIVLDEAPTATAGKAKKKVVPKKARKGVITQPAAPTDSEWVIVATVPEVQSNGITGHQADDTNIVNQIPKKRQGKQFLSQDGMLDELMGIEAASGAHHTQRKRKIGSETKEKAPKKPKSQVVKAAREDATFVVPAVSNDDVKNNGKDKVSSPASIDDSVKDGKQLLQWIIGELSVDQFIKDYWEQKHYFAQHGIARFDGLFSVKQFEQIMQKDYLEFGTNINLARYVDGKRETPNPTGRVLASTLWEFYEAGCSIQFINPQSYSDSVWQLCTRLQEYFCSFVGANRFIKKGYLTPPGTQGFAPHWDDVDVFVMQLEGRKKWRVYAPSGDDTTLPRESSGNFSQEEVDANNKLIFEGWVNPGDMLFMPRGFLHQGLADSSSHSFHLTVSVGHHNTYADMFEKLLPEVLSHVISSTSSMRKSLPPGYLDVTGVSRAENPKVIKSVGRGQFRTHVKAMMNKISDSVMEMCDSGADMMAANFIKQALPPFLGSGEREQTAETLGRHWVGEQAVQPFNMSLQTHVKFIRQHSQRLLLSTEETGSLDHRMFNSRVFEGRPNSSVPLEADELDVAQHLIDQYPLFTKVGDFPMESDEEKLALAEKLWRHCLLVTK